MWKHLNNIFISLGKIPRSAIVLLHGRYIFIILRNCPKVLWSSYSTFTFGKVIYEIFSCFTCIPALCTVNLIYFSYFNGCIVIMIQFICPLWSYIEYLFMRGQLFSSLKSSNLYAHYNGLICSYYWIMDILLFLIPYIYPNYTMFWALWWIIFQVHAAVYISILTFMKLPFFFF